MQPTPLSSKKLMSKLMSDENSTSVETDKTKEVGITPNHSPALQRLAAEVTEAAMKIINANPDLQAYLHGEEPKPV